MKASGCENFGIEKEEGQQSKEKQDGSRVGRRGWGRFLPITNGTVLALVFRRVMMMSAFQGQDGRESDENNKNRRAEYFPKKIHDGHY